MEIGAVLPQRELGTDVAALRDYAQGVQDLGYDFLVSVRPRRGRGSGGPPEPGAGVPHRQPGARAPDPVLLPGRGGPPAGLPDQRGDPAPAPDGAGGQAGGGAGRPQRGTLPLRGRDRLEPGGVRRPGPPLPQPRAALRGADHPPAPAVDGALRQRGEPLPLLEGGGHQPPPGAAAGAHLDRRLGRSGGAAGDPHRRRLPAPATPGGWLGGDGGEGPRLAARGRARPRRLRHRRASRRRRGDARRLARGDRDVAPPGSLAPLRGHRRERGRRRRRTWRDCARCRPCCSHSRPEPAEPDPTTTPSPAYRYPEPVAHRPPRHCGRRPRRPEEALHGIHHTADEAKAPARPCQARADSAHHPHGDLPLLRRRRLPPR